MRITRFAEPLTAEDEAIVRMAWTGTGWPVQGLLALVDKLRAEAVDHRDVAAEVRQRVASRDTLDGFVQSYEDMEPTYEGFGPDDDWVRRSAVLAILDDLGVPS